MKRRVLIAGASGFVGREVVRLLGDQVAAAKREHGERAVVPWEIVALCHRQAPDDLYSRGASSVISADALVPARLEALGRDFDAVISCMGASVALSHAERRGYGELDYTANSNLLRAVKSDRLERFVYLSLFVQPGYAKCRYVAAHERFVDELTNNRVTTTIVRPTGVFSALSELITFAKQRRFMVLGSGEARSNPIHPIDVAQACVAALAGSTTEIACGGPDVLTRREMVQLAAAAVGNSTPKIRSIPPGAFGLASAVARPFNRRMSDLLEFAAKVATTDCVAPVRGANRLEEYFFQLARPPALVAAGGASHAA